MTRTATVFTLLCLISWSLWAQPKTANERMVDHIMGHHPDIDAAIEIHRSGGPKESSAAYKAAALSRLAERDTLGYLYALHQMAHQVSHQGMIDSALVLYEEAFKLSEDRDSDIYASIASALATFAKYRGDLRQAISYTKIYAEVMEYDGSPYDLGVAYRLLGDYYRSLSLLDSCRSYLNLAEKQFRAIDSEFGLLRTDVTWARYFEDIHDYDRSLDLRLGIRQRWRELGESEANGAINTVNIANNLLSSGDFKRAGIYAEEALQETDRLNLKLYKSYALNTMAQVAQAEGDIVKAEDYYKRTLDLSKRTSDKGFLYQGYINYAQMLLGVGRSESALLLIDTILSRASETEYAEIRTRSKIIQSQAQLKLGQLSQAEGHYREALDMADEMDDPYLQREVYQGLAEISERRKDYTAAYTYLTAVHRLEDSLDQRSRAELAQQLESKYRFEQQQSEIAQLDTERKLLLTKNNSRYYLLLLAGLGLLLLGGLALWLYRLYNKTSEQEKLIKESLADKEVLLKEIHHRVKNNLQIISSLLNLHSRQISDPVAKQAILEGRNRVKSMALIHQNLYQEEDLVHVQSREYVDKLVSSILSSYKLNPDQVNLSLEVEDLSLTVDTVIPMGLILNELVSNSLKYAFYDGRNGELVIRLYGESDSYVLEVQDDGPGFDPDTLDSTSSLGYRIVQSFARKLDARLEVNGSEGTHIRLYIPIGASEYAGSA